MATVNIDLNTNVNNALKGIKSFSAQATKAVSGIGSAFTDLRTIAAGAIASIGFAKIVQAAAQQEQAVQKLNTALALSGELSEETTQSFLDFTSALQANSTVGDEVSLGLVGLAKSFGASNEQAKQILQTAADLSAVTGESLESAVRNLSKTLGGLKGELGETQPELRGLTKEQLQAGKAIDVLNKKFAGAAKALTRTFSGAVKQTSNSFGDLVEEFGKFITDNPTIVAGLNLLGEVFGDLGRTIEANREGIAKYISDGIRVFIDLIPRAIRVAKSFATSLVSIPNEIAGLRASVFRDINAVIQVFDDLLTSVQNVTANALQPLKGVLNDVTDALLEYGIISGETATNFDNFAQDVAQSADGLGSVLDKPIEDFGKYKDAAEKSFEGTKKVVDDTKAFFDRAASSVETYGQKLDGLEDKVKNARQNLQNLSDSNVEVTVSVDSFAREQRTAAQVIDDTQASAKKLQDELNKLFAKRQTPEDDIAKTLELLNKLREKFASSGVMSEAEIATLAQTRVEAEQFISKTVEERNKKALVDQKKLANDAKKNVENLTAIGVSGLLGQIATLGFGDDFQPQQGERLEFDPESLEVQKIAVDIETTFEKQIANLVSIFPDSFRPVFDAIGTAVTTVFPSSDFTTSIVGASNQLLRGAEGAQEFLQTGAAAAADAFLPGLGQAVGPLVAALSQGPEFVRQQVEAFVGALPILLDNIARSIPVLIELLAEAAPDIIIALVKATPAIVRALSIGLIKIGPLLAKEIVSSLTAEIDTIFGTDFAVKFDTNIERFEGVAEGLQDKYVSSVEDASENLAKNIDTELNKITSGFEDFGKFIVDSIKEGAERFAQEISNSFGPVFEGFRQTFEEIIEIFSGIGPALGTALRNGAQFLINGIGESLRFLVRAVNNVLNGAREFFGGIIKSLAGLGPALLEVLKAGGGFLLDGIISGIEKLAAGGEEFLNNVVLAIDNILQPFFTLLEGVGTLLQDAGASLLKGLDAILSPLAEAFSNFDKTVTKFLDFSLPEISFAELPSIDLSPGIDSLAGSITSAFDPIIEFFKDLSFDLPSVSGGGGGGGGVLGSISDALGFADGGRIPEGFPNDSFPARLSSGEEVIDRSTSEDLREFLAGQGGGQNVTISLQIGEKQLADVLVNLDRQGFRVTA